MPTYPTSPNGFHYVPLQPPSNGGLQVPLISPTTPIMTQNALAVSPGHSPAMLPGATLANGGQAAPYPTSSSYNTSPLPAMPAQIASPFQPPAGLVNPLPINAGMQQPFVTYQPQPVNVVNMRFIPGMPTAVPELPEQDLIGLAVAEYLFREISKSSGKYSCWPIHDLYSWFMLIHFGPVPLKDTNPISPNNGYRAASSSYKWELSRKGVPPLQNEGYRLWVEKSRMYGQSSLDWFRYQFIMSTQMFWMYRRYPMASPAYVALPFEM